MRYLFLIPGLVLLLAISSTHGSTIVWNNPSGGNWSDKSNWKPKQIPNFGDIAIITNSGNYTVTLDTGGSVSGLVLGAGDGTTQTISFNGQTLTLSGDATINTGGSMDLSSGTFNGDTNSGGAILDGTLTCSGGALAGKFTVASNSVLSLATSNALAGVLLFTNYGSVNWNAADLYGAPSLHILNFGTWNLPTTNTFYGNGTVFNNIGVLNKSAEPGGATVFDSNTVINTTGTIAVNRGNLVIQTGTGSGTFYVSPTFNSSLSVGSLSGFTFSGNSTFSGDGRPVTFMGVVNVASNAVLNLTSIGTFTIIFNGGVFNNYGTVNWFDGHFNAISSSTINNYGTWDAKNNNTIEGESAGTSVFNNFGTLRKSGGVSTGGYSTMFGGVYRLPFNNFSSGTIDVLTGVTVFQGGITDSGTINIASNAVVAAYGILSGNPVFSGLGKMKAYLYGSNVVVHGVLTLTNNSKLSGALTLETNMALNLASLPGSTMEFAGLVMTNCGTVNWIDNDIQCSSNSQIQNFGLWDAKTNNTFAGGSGATFNNYGIFRKSGGGLDIYYATYFDNHSAFNNYGTVDVQAGTVACYQAFDAGTVNTSSNTVFYAGTGTLGGAPAFSGDGAVEGSLNGINAVIHGVLNFYAGPWAECNLFGTLTVASNATLNLIEGSHPPFYNPAPVTFNGVVFTNYGTVNWLYNDLHGGYSPQIRNYGLWNVFATNTFFGAYVGGGTTVFNNFGTFRKLGGSTFLDGNTIFTNAGTVDIQAGQLVVGDDCSLVAGGLNFGINSSSDFGKLAFAGTGALAGTLSVNLNNGFSPVASDSFPLIVGSTTGSFTGMSLPPLASGLIWRTNLELNLFVLSVSNVPPFSLSSGSVAQGSGSFSFSFEAVVGQIYQVQCTTNLAPANWIDVGSPITATNISMTVSDLVGTNQHQFYRVVLQ